jgi:hypothetical protein
MVPERAVRKSFMVLQAFIDESYDGGGWFVMAGYLANADRWAEFSKDWGELLPKFGVLDIKTGNYHFHMTEMMHTEERRARIPVFGRVIEQHLDFMMSLRIFIPDIERAQQRLFVPGRELGRFPVTTELYRLGWNQILATFAASRETISEAVSIDANVEFIFDEAASRKKLLAAWEAKDQEYPVLSSRFDTIPRFEDDKEFVALQAADMLAWRVLRVCPPNSSTTERLARLYPLWENPKPMRHLDMPLSEDGIVAMLMDHTADNVPSDTAIIDRKTGLGVQGRATI